MATSVTKVNGVTYSVMVPMPGERHRFDPMYDEEAAWRHMGMSVNAAIPVFTKFEHESDYGNPTELEHVAVFGELVQGLVPTQPWHRGKVVILARNHSLQACLHCSSTSALLLNNSLEIFAVAANQFP